MHYFLLDITFAKLNPDFTWEPREFKVKVRDTYSQTPEQVRETAQKFAQKNEVVFKVLATKLSFEEIRFRFARNCQVTWDMISYDNQKQETENCTKGEYIDVAYNVFGYLVKDQMVSLYRDPDEDGYSYIAKTHRDNLEAFYYDGQGNTILVPLPF